jgi:hypothetical protein
MAFDVREQSAVRPGSFMREERYIGYKYESRQHGLDAVPKREIPGLPASNRAIAGHNFYIALIYVNKITNSYKTRTRVGGRTKVHRIWVARMLPARGVDVCHFLTFCPTTV